MKKLLLVVTAFLVLLSTSQAEDKGEYRIVKFGATWCGPCHVMDKVWADKDVVKATKNYKGKDGKHTWYVDHDKHRNLILHYKVDALPTVIIINSKGKSVRRAKGIMNKQQLLNFLNNEIVETSSGNQQEEVLVYEGLTILRWVVIALAKLSLFILGGN